jgi:hypothetical protein
LIAYHEAGHAVVAHKLGIAITNITMIPADGYGAAVHTHNELVAKQGNGDPAAQGFYVMGGACRCRRAEPHRLFGEHPR